MDRPAAPPATDAETLLEDVDGARRLARRLLDDEHLAEDVAQESALIALRKPPRAGWTFRTWLSGIARRVSKDWRRRDLRRLARERSAARPEGAMETPAHEAEERLAVQRRVLDAVHALDEGQRTVILLRFFEGLPPRRIAARLGVPVETVRTRTKRALVRLRADLDAQSGGDRDRWCLALVPLADARGGTWDALRRILLMTVQTKVGLAVSGAALAALLWFGVPALRGGSQAPRGGDGADPAAVAGTERTDAPGGRSGLSGRAGAGTRGGAAAPEAVIDEAPSNVAEGIAKDGATLLGRVTTPEGAPLEGARVRLFPDDPLLGYLRVAKEARWSVLEVLTDAKGAFAFHRVLPGNGYAVVATASDRAMARVHDLGLRSREVKRLEDLVVSAGGTLLVRVSSAEGKPVPGARVSVAPKVSHTLQFVLARADTLPFVEAIGETDAEGRARVAHLAAGAKTLIVEKSGFASALVQDVAVPASGESAPAEVTLAPPGTITGRAVHADGSPAATARILATFEKGVVGHSADARPDGTFVLEGLPQGDCQISALVTGLSPITFLPAKTGDTGIEIRFPTPGSVRGRVVVKGRGIALTRYEIRPRPQVPKGESDDFMRSFVEDALRTAMGPLAVRSASGAFAFDRLEPRPHRFEVTAEGYPRTTSAPVEVRAGGTVEDVVIEVEPAAGIEGVVVDAEGKPVANASVALALRGEDGPGIAGGILVTRGKHVGVTIDRGVVDIRIGDDDPSPPVSDVRTGPDGAFALPPVEPGTYELTILAGDHAPQVVETKVEAGRAPAPLRVTVRPGGVVEGRVEESTGAPGAGKRIALAGNGAYVVVVADEQGAFRFERVPPGKYAVVPLLGDPTAASPRAQEALVAAAGGTPVEVFEKQVANATVRIPRLPRVEGLLDGLPAGVPAGGHTVSLYPQGVEGESRPPFRYETLTDDRGEFALQNVVPGRYRAWAMVRRPNPDDEGNLVEFTTFLDLVVAPGADRVPLRFNAPR